jgi:hypothetical protein
MAIRIQIRRDTAANWTSSNPVLRAGEFGVETDTLKFKIGNGTSTWTQITTYANVTPTGLSSSLGDYILSADQGNAGGPAELDSNGDLIVPQNSVILWNDDAHSYSTTLTATQPTADRTITIPNATGTVALAENVAALSGATFTGNISVPSQIIFEGATANDFETTLAVTDPTADRTITFPDLTGTVVTTGDTGSVTNLMLAGSIANDKLSNSAITINGTSTSLGGTRTLGTDDISEGSTNKYFSDERAQDAIGNSVGTGLSYNDTTGAISVDTSAIQARVTNVTDTEIGYLDGVTSAIQTQINDKLASATASTTYAPIASPTFTGTVTLAADPASALQAATKQYVDNTASGVVAKPQVLGATTANIDATYSNGTAGVGATLTHNTNGVFPSGAGGASGWAVGKGILVKNQTNKEENGRYYISNMGSPSTPYVLTRCGYCDEASEIPGAYIFVQDGTSAGTGWIQTVADAATFVVGTDDINVYQFSGSGTYTAGTGLTLTGNEYSINTSVTADLSTAQTLTNKTLTSPVINTPTGITKSDVGLANVDNTTDANKPVSTATQTALDLKLASATAATTYETITNVALKAPIASPTFTGTVAGITSTMVGLGNVDNTSDANKPVSTATQTALDLKVDESLFDAKGDLMVASADNTPAKLSVGTNGYLLTANSSATNGVEWAAAPVSLPPQTGNSGKYLTTDGSSATWGTLVVPITTSSSTLSSNSITTIDETEFGTWSSIEYMVSLKQGTKVRTSKVIVQTNTSAVDMTEYAITETGGTISGVLISASEGGMATSAILKLTVTDAATTNVTVKLSKVVL